MLQFINDLPPHVVGVHAIGEVTSDDYNKVMKPKLEDLVNRQGDINFLVVLETDAQSFSAATWFEDLKLALKHFTHWNRIAFVSDQKGVEWFSNILRFLIPGKTKGFSLTELDEAVKWISEDEPQPKEQSK